MSTRIHTRIDADLKEEVAAIFSRLGLTEGEAIRLFYSQVKLRGGLPFEVVIPNDATIEAMEELEHPEDLPRYASFRDIRQELEV